MLRLAAVLLAVSFLVTAQSERAIRRIARRPAAAPTIRADIGLIEIPVTVTGPLGEPFRGLTSKAFRVYEDGVAQDLKYLTVQDTPVSLGIVFDSSQSMIPRVERARVALKHLFRTAIPGDEFLLVEFNDTAQLRCDFTSDPERIERAVQTVTPEGWTSLYDAVYLAIQQMKHAQNTRRALFILSDGADNNSRYTEGELRNLIRESGVIIYTLGIDSGTMLNHHYRFLRRLALDTGGQFDEVDDADELQPAVESLSRAMRHQYLLSYFSNNPKVDGLYRKVKVQLSPEPGTPPLRASWRTGYYSIAPR